MAAWFFTRWRVRPGLRRCACAGRVGLVVLVFSAIVTSLAHSSSLLAQEARPLAYFTGECSITGCHAIGRQPIELGPCPRRGAGGNGLERGADLGDRLRP